MDKITLTKKQFERWLKQSTLVTHEKNMWRYPILAEQWSALVAESQRPELIERWAVFNEHGDCWFSANSKEGAEKWRAMTDPKNCLRIVHLVEKVD